MEAAGRAETLTGEDTLTLAQQIRLNQERERSANCEQCRLIIGLSCDKGTTPAKLIPDAAPVYKILHEKLAVETNLQHSAVVAIFATEPSNPWSWSVIFDSIARKQIYEQGMPGLKRILGLPMRIGYDQRVLLSSSL